MRGIRASVALRVLFSLVYSSAVNFGMVSGWYCQLQAEYIMECIIHCFKDKQKNGDTAGFMNKQQSYYVRYPRFM